MKFNNLIDIHKRFAFIFCHLVLFALFAQRKFKHLFSQLFIIEFRVQQLPYKQFASRYHTHTRDSHAKTAECLRTMCSTVDDRSFCLQSCSWHLDIFDIFIVENYTFTLFTRHLLSFARYSAVIQFHNYTCVPVCLSSIVNVHVDLSICIYIVFI